MATFRSKKKSQLNFNSKSSKKYKVKTSSKGLNIQSAAGRHTYAQGGFSSANMQGASLADQKADAEQVQGVQNNRPPASSRSVRARQAYEQSRLELQNREQSAFKEDTYVNGRSSDFQAQSNKEYSNVNRRFDNQNPFGSSSSTKGSPSRVATSQLPKAGAFNNKQGSQKNKGNASKTGSFNPYVQMQGKQGAQNSLNGRAAQNGILSFILRNRVLSIIAAIIVVLLLIGVIDLVTSLGKVHAGVKVQGVDVGGLSEQDAAQRIEEQLKPQLSEAQITIYKNEETATNDGAQLVDLSSVSGGHVANAASTANASESNSSSSDSSSSESSSDSSSDSSQDLTSENNQTATGVDMDSDGKADKWTISASSVGASIDANALAKKAYAVGRTFPFMTERISAFFGNFNFAAQITCNSDVLTPFTTELNDNIGQAIQDYMVNIEDGKTSISDGHDGLVVDVDNFTTNICAAFFNKSTPSTIIPMKTATLHITQETAQKVKDQIDSALSEEMKISYKEKSWTVDAANLGSLIKQQVLASGEVIVFADNSQKVEKESDGATASYKATTSSNGSGYSLQAYIDQEKADSYIVSLLGDEAKGDVKDASFDVSSGEVEIIESSVGTGPDHHSAAKEMQDDLFGSNSSRSIEIKEVTIQPSISTEDAQNMGIKERLASWSIPLSGTSARISNIKLLCKLINGSLVKPGDTWSFNATTGERTEEKGFQKAPVIVNGAHEDQLGGGVCQVATCVFNSACYSGLGIDSRVNHSFYIPSYDDEGFADATVSWPNPDFAFVNDMSTWVYLSATANDGYVRVSLWGTKDGRTVTCDRGEWVEGEKYQQIRQEDPSMAAGKTEVTQSGVDGRKITIHYLVKSATGDVLHDINFKSEYIAQDEITKVGTGSG